MNTPPVIDLSDPFESWALMQGTRVAIVLGAILVFGLGWVMGAYWSAPVELVAEVR